jgi:hypothetical protein
VRELAMVEFGLMALAAVFACRDRGRVRPSSPSAAVTTA